MESKGNGGWEREKVREGEKSRKGEQERGGERERERVSSFVSID